MIQTVLVALQKKKKKGNRHKKRAIERGGTGREKKRGEQNDNSNY